MLIHLLYCTLTSILYSYFFIYKHVNAHCYITNWHFKQSSSSHSFSCEILSPSVSASIIQEFNIKPLKHILKSLPAVLVNSFTVFCLVIYCMYHISFPHISPFIETFNNYTPLSIPLVIHFCLYSTFLIILFPLYFTTPSHFLPYFSILYSLFFSRTACQSFPDTEICLLTSDGPYSVMFQA